MRGAWRRPLGPPHLPLTLVPPSRFVYYIQLSGTSTCSLTRSGWKKSAHRETLFAPYLAWAIFPVGIPFTGVLRNVQTGRLSLNLDTAQWTLAEGGDRFCSVILVCAQFSYNFPAQWLDFWTSELLSKHPDTGEGTEKGLASRESQVSLSEELALHLITRIETSGMS